MFGSSFKCGHLNVDRLENDMCVRERETVFDKRDHYTNQHKDFCVQILKGTQSRYCS